MSLALIVSIKLEDTTGPDCGDLIRVERTETVLPETADGIAVDHADLLAAGLESLVAESLGEAQTQIRLLRRLLEEAAG